MKESVSTIYALGHFIEKRRKLAEELENCDKAIENLTKKYLEEIEQEKIEETNKFFNYLDE